MIHGKIAGIPPSPELADEKEVADLVRRAGQIRARGHSA